MMKCTDMRELLSAYADGELRRTQREYVEAHLARCTECQELLANYVQIGRLVSSLETIPVMANHPSSIREGAMSKIKIGYEPKRNRRVWQVAIASALIVALIVGMSVAIPLLTEDSNIALAAEQIARNSESFGFISEGQGDLILVEVVEQDDDQATVTFATEAGKQITFQVDLRAEKVVETDKWVGFPLWGPYEPYEQVGDHILFLKGGPEFEEAIRIALADPRVQEQIPEGPVIESVGLREERVANARFWPADLKELPVLGGHYIMEGPNVTVDLDTKEVIAINNSQASIQFVQFEYILEEEERQEVIEIISTDPKVKQLLAEGFAVERMAALDPSNSIRIADVALMPDDTFGKTIVDGYYVRIDLDTKEILGGNDEIMVKAPMIVVQIHE